MMPNDNDSLPVLVECDGEKLEVVSSYWRMAFDGAFRDIIVRVPEDGGAITPAPSIPACLTRSTTVVDISKYDVSNDAGDVSYDILSAHKRNNFIYLSTRRRPSRPRPEPDVLPLQLRAIQAELLRKKGKRSETRVGPWLFERNDERFVVRHESDPYPVGCVGDTVEEAYRTAVNRGVDLALVNMTPRDRECYNDMRAAHGLPPLPQ
jgi:hypothetical protein